jgi:hypothetical protein
MIQVTFKAFSKILNKSFVNTKTVRNMEDFRLFAMALYHGQVEIIETKKV